MNHPAAVAFLVALAAVAVGCGGPTPQKVCDKLKDLESVKADCLSVWTAKQTNSAAAFKTQSACVLEAVTGAEAGKCTAVP